MFSLHYVYEFTNHADCSQLPQPRSKTTEIHLPRRRYGSLLESGDARVSVSSGSWTWNNEVSCFEYHRLKSTAYSCSQEQILIWTHQNLTPGFLHRLEISVPNRLHWKDKPANIDLKDSPLRWLLAFAVLLAAIVINRMLTLF